MYNSSHSVLSTEFEIRDLTDKKAVEPQEGLWSSNVAGTGGTGKGADWSQALPPLGFFFLVLSPLQLGFSVEEVHVVGQEVGAGGPCSAPPGPGGGPPWVPDPLGE